MQRASASVVSHTPGRLRIRLDPGGNRAVLVARSAAELRQLPAVLQVQSNPRTGSLLVRYDRQAASPEQVVSAVERRGIQLRATRERHPVFRLAGTLTRLPRYAGLALRLLQDPNLPGARRVVLMAGMAYVALPIDLVPGVIPILGQLDDLAIFLLALRQALNGLPPAVAAGYLEHAGLAATVLDSDLQAVRDVLVWMVRGAARLLSRGARLLVSAPPAGSGSSVLARRAGPG